MQRRWRARRRQGSLRLLLEGDRGNEIVATSRNSDDITLAALPVTESAAQSADLNLQICLFDESLGPSSGDQLFLGAHLANAFDQSRQDVKGAAAQPYRLLAFQQEPSRRKQAERAKRDRASVHGSSPGSLFLPFFTCPRP